MSKITEIEHFETQDKELVQFLETVDSYTVPASRTKDDAWDNIVIKLENSFPSKDNKTVRFPIRTLMSAAAALLVVAIGWYLFKAFDTKEIFVPNGKTATIELPDKSIVKLNSGSTIHYNQYTWKGNRHVNLDGEAFFEVAKGTPFVVESRGNRITVLGTGFNVYSRNDKFEVSCFSGKVRVYLQNNDSVVLVKGKAVTSFVNISKCDTFSFNTQQAACWRNGEFYFNQQELKLVFEEMERQFNVAIQMPDLTMRYYTGFFRSVSLEDALQNVCLPMGVKYSIIDSSNVVIKAE